MTPERLAEIEKWAKERPLGTTTLELVAALREAQQNQLDTERTYVRLRDFHDTQMEAARAECDTLAATLERVRALAKKWDKDWETSGSVPAAGAIRNCTFELRRAVLGQDVLRRGDPEQQQQQIDASEGEEH